MDNVASIQSPFAIVTFIVAPALLTNASSVLAMSTINRMLRTRDRMAELFGKSKATNGPENERTHLLMQVDRVERQGLLLLRALRAIYVALGSFAAATLGTLIAAVLEQVHLVIGYRALTSFGMVVGVTGVTALVTGTWRLFQATRLSMVSISEEAAIIRQHQASRQSGISSGVS